MCNNSLIIDVYKRQDLIFKMLSYFAYNFLMVLIITLQIFRMQVNPFEGFSVFDDRVVPVSYTHLDVYKRQILYL